MTLKQRIKYRWLFIKHMFPKSPKRCLINMKGQLETLKIGYLHLFDDSLVNLAHINVLAELNKEDPVSYYLNNYYSIGAVRSMRYLLECDLGLLLFDYMDEFRTLGEMLEDGIDLDEMYPDIKEKYNISLNEKCDIWQYA